MPCHPGSLGGVPHTNLRSLETLLPDASPSTRNLDQAILPEIIPSAGISPVFRPVHIAPFDRIIVYVIQLLSHGRFVLDKLRMVAFFPDLISGLGFMRAFEKSQHFQNSRRATPLQIIDDFPRRVGFETVHVTA